ncbi:hypothetical protein OPEN69S_00429 [Ottowia pentelensis]
MCARRRTFFSLRRQRKEGKRKATPLAVSLRCAAGNLRCSRLGRCCGTRCVHCAHFARTTAASQNTLHGHALLPMPAPAAALLGTARGDFKAGAERSDGPHQNPCGCACSAVLAGWRVHRRMHAFRGLTRGGCLSGENAVNAASSTAHPASATTQVCPVAKRRGRRLGVAFSLPTFFWRSKRKWVRCRAHIPASRCLQSQLNIEQQRARSNAAGPSPQPSPQRGEGAKTQARADA